jgi:hypothetical protein
MQIDAESNAAQTQMWRARLQQRNATKFSSGTGLGVAATGFAPPIPGSMAPPMLAPHPAGTSSDGLGRADSIDFVSPAIPRSTSLGDMDSRLVDQLGIALQEQGKLDEMKRYVQSQQQAGVTKKDRVTKLLTKLVALLGIEVVVAATNAVVVSTTDVDTMLLKALKDRLTPSQRSALEQSLSAHRTGRPMDHIKFMQTQVDQHVIVQSLCEVRKNVYCTVVRSVHTPIAP